MRARTRLHRHSLSPEPSLLAYTMNEPINENFVLITKESSEGSDKPAQPLQGSLRLEKYLNIQGFLEKSLKIKFASNK